MLRDIVEPCAIVDNDFFWVKLPILNERMCLAMIDDAALGTNSSRGFKKREPATKMSAAWGPIVPDGSAWRIHLKRELVRKLMAPFRLNFCENLLTDGSSLARIP